MESTVWWDYVLQNIEGSTMRDAAHKAGFDQSTFTRWKKGARPDPDFVLKFARAFHLNVLEALVKAGFITDDEAKLRQVETGGVRLRQAANEELLAEILRRSEPEGRKLFERAGNVVDIDTKKTEPDHAVIIAGINAGTEAHAAHRVTEPLEEHFT